MILLYHSIVPDPNWRDRRHSSGYALPLGAFRNHMRSLQSRFHIVPLSELLEQRRKQKPEGRLIALTFDDGLKITFQQVYSLLEPERLAATFFVTTGHLEHGKLLWFTYLNALCYESTYESLTTNGTTLPLRTVADRKRTRQYLARIGRASGDPSQFCVELLEAFPLPAEIMARHEGMTHEQLAVAGNSSWIEIGSHTLTHPYLSQQSGGEQSHEITRSRELLSRLTGKSIRYFAYPSGDYNRETLRAVRAAGYEAAFAIIPLRLDETSGFEIERVGIYSPSLLKLHLKALGYASWFRQLGLRVG